MSKENNLTDFLTGVANAIRTKKGTTEAINPQNFESEIASISSGKPETAPTVTLNLASGNQVVTPSEGQVFSQVTITKPSTLLASNIKKDVSIAGVVGTFEGGGGASIQNFSGTFAITGDNQDWMYHFFGFENGGFVYRNHGYYQSGAQVSFQNSCLLVLVNRFGSGFYMVSPSDAELVGPDYDNNTQLFKITGSNVTIYENED